MFKAEILWALLLRDALDRRGILVAQLNEGGEAPSGRLSKVGKDIISEWSAATRRLDDLKAEADKTRMEKDEVQKFHWNLNEYTHLLYIPLSTCSA